MGYRRLSIAATDEEMDVFSWSSPTDAWPDRRALCPKGGQETGTEGSPSWKQAVLSFLEQGQVSPIIIS